MGSSVDAAADCSSSDVFSAEIVESWLCDAASSTRCSACNPASSFSNAAIVDAAPTASRSTIYFILYLVPGNRGNINTIPYIYW